jgi:hypothetical protein
MHAGIGFAIIPSFRRSVCFGVGDGGGGVGTTNYFAFFNF